ncbi:MAG TPA: glycoside hydrolase family 3 C-terminal domain-containing protein [Vicinamibacteria bacterium]|nr:glycoside hydrolase family 3 C-terminal domain-containing protein [Vicinamibacteria bacterium]
MPPHHFRTHRCGLLLGSVLALTTTSPARAQTPAVGPATTRAPYLDPSLPLERRVEDLVSRMTLPEKIGQMQDQAAAIPRLGVPAYGWWNESLHGVAFGGYATVFPQVIGMAATWDTDLVHGMAQAISTEARAKYHRAMREDQHERFFGLTFWAPNVNIFRDPRWGRGQETYGEDPFLTGRMAVAFVSGMQGEDPKYLKVVSTPKHFAVHSGPEPLRHGFDVKVSPHDLEDTYLPAFRAAVAEAHAQSVMCAYNAVDGRPACASPMLLRDHLREAWRFDGYVVSDCAAVADIATGHGFAPDFAHASAAAVQAGTDLECQYGQGTAFPSLTESIKQGLVSEAELDRALRRLFTARFRLGMFDPAESYAYGRIPFTEVNSAEHRQLAQRAAREAIVLLKNDRGFLPLAAGLRTIAVVGPTAELVQSLQGNYNGTPRDPVTPISGIERRFKDKTVLYAQGATLAEGFGVPIAHTALRTADGKEGLRGEYFSRPDLTGDPVAVRVDRTVNFNWDKALPVAGLQRNHFSVRWTGTITPPAAGEYGIGARVADCYACESHEQFRVYLDDKLVADATGPDRTQAPVRFDDTKPHAIRLEYLHGTAAAGIDLLWQPPAAPLLAEAVTVAKRADVVVAFVGLSPQLEGEEMPVKLEGFAGGDRIEIRLPKVQRELLQALSATGKPLVLVLTSGSALAIPEEQGFASAVLAAWYPGEEGGTAIAETLAGDNNPAGRLPVTFYASVDQLPPFTEYSMANRTYRYFTGKPLYGFGYGLSYSKFEYSNPRLSSPSVKAGEPVTVEVDVRNVSSRAGDEVVEVYLSQPKAAVSPLRTLAGFRRVRIEPGRTEHILFHLDPRTLGQVDEKGERVIVPGTYTVAIGGAQPAEFPAAVTATFSVTGSQTLAR